MSVFNKISLAQNIIENFEGLELLNMSDLIVEHLMLNRDKFDKNLVDSTLNLIKRKRLIPDDLALDTLNSAIIHHSHYKYAKAFLIVGFPRTLQQAKEWYKYVCILYSLIFSPS